MKVSPVQINTFSRVLGAQANRASTNFATKNVGADSVSFGMNKPVNRNLNLDYDTAEFVAHSLSNSTSGHRAKYNSKTFTPEVVKLISLGVAQYAKDEARRQFKEPTVLIGGDTREASRKSLPLIKKTLLNQNVNVISIEDPVPTPLLAVAAKKYGTDISVLMTASHNPWEDGGYNLVTKAGAVAPQSVTKQVADNMLKIAKEGRYTEYPTNEADETILDPYLMYVDNLNALDLIDWKNIQDSGVEAFYDGLNGTGSYVMPKLLKHHDIPFVEVHSKGQKGPNPTDENLKVLENYLSKNDNKMAIGIANDGDADRFGIVDENGNFIDANDVILLTAYHLIKNKNRTGAIVRSQATSKNVDEIAKMYDSKLVETPVGFKYIAEDILDERKAGGDILVAGEESGGLTVNRHIPEKDGIVALSLMLDLVASEGKPISEILKDVKESMPKTYVSSKFNKKLESEEDKAIIMARAEKMFNDVKEAKNFYFDENHTIDRQKTIEHAEKMEKYKKGGDGVMLVLDDDSTVLVRKSGTEPLVKCYIEASGETPDMAIENSKQLNEKMQEMFKI